MVRLSVPFCTHAPFPAGSSVQMPNKCNRESRYWYAAIKSAGSLRYLHRLRHHYEKHVLRLYWASRS
jgi:hypothetical protein